MRLYPPADPLVGYVVVALLTAVSLALMAACWWAR